MGNRRLPFGYEMSNGKPAVMQSEAEVVRWIFDKHHSGASYDLLTRELRTQVVPYDSGKAWNKNMVARILKDKRYLGTEMLSALIGENLYNSVQINIPAKAPPCKKRESTNTLQRLAICGGCGTKVRRDSHQHGRERWQCPNCKAISTKATDIRLEQSVSDILIILYQAPDIIKAIPHATNTSNTVQQRKDEFDSVINRAEFDEARAKALAISLSAARFEALGSEDYETLRIRHLVADARQSVTLDTELLRQIASSVLIHPNGEISLKLKNGQIIGRSDIT